MPRGDACGTGRGARARERARGGAREGMPGHARGAAGAVEAGLRRLCREHGFVPGTVGLERPGPELAVHHAARGGVSAPIESVLSNSFGFGGNNAALVFGHA